MIDSVIKRHFSFLVDEHSYTAVTYDEEEVFFKKNNLAIRVVVDRDGVGLYCVDIKSMLCYNLSLFILNKRGGELRYPSSDDLSTQRDYALEHYSNSLKNKAPDIVEGNLKWTRDYGWTPLKLSGPLIEFLLTT